MSIEDGSFSFILLSTKGARPTVTAAAEGKIRQDGQDMAEAIHACLPGPLHRKRLMKSAPLIEIVRGRNIFTKVMEMPRMPGQDAVATLTHIEKDSVMFLLSDAAVDVAFHDAANGSGKAKVVFTAIEKETIDAVRARRTALGFRRGGACSAAAAVFSMIERSRALHEKAPSLVVTVGRSGAGIYAHWRGAPLFAREIRFGADFSAPETNETSSTEPSAGLDNPDIRERLDEPLRQLKTEIFRSIDFFKSSSGGASVEKAHLMFDGAPVKGLAEYLSEEMDTVFCEYNPFGDIVDIPPGAASSVISGRESVFAPLAGAALCRSYVACSRRKWRLSARSAPVKWLKAAAVAAAIAIGAASAASETVRRFELLDEAIASKNKLAESLAAVEAETKRIAAKVARLEKQNAAWETMLRSLDNSPRVQNWETVFHEIALSVPGNSALSRWTLDFDGGGRSGNIVIEGVSRGPSKQRIADVGALYKSLRSSLSLDSVTLNKTVLGKSDSGEELLNFEIHAGLPQAPHSAASMASGEAPGS